MPPVRRYPAVSAPETMPVLPDTPALANKVSKLPYSTLPRACRPLVGAAVTTLPPPPIAWLPHGTELGPRKISTRSIDPDNRLAKSNPPPGDDGSLTRTPSINVSVCSPSAPRIRTALNPPIPPLRVTVTPGVVASKSDSATDWRWSIVARSISVTAWPPRSAGCSTPVEVTTMSESGVGYENTPTISWLVSSTAWASDWSPPFGSAGGRSCADAGAATKASGKTLANKMDCFNIG